MILRTLGLLSLLLSLAFADVEVTSPSAGQEISGNSITVKWADSGDTPPISAFVSYSIYLCAGGNLDTNFIQLQTLATGVSYSKGNSITVSIDNSVGGTDTNAYFFKIISAATGGTITNYSDRFTLTDMTGSFPPVVTSGLATVSGTSGPPTENNIGKVATAAATQVQIVSASFALPFTMQTGPIRYAPMPALAGSKITAKNASPLYPQSSYNPYTTFAGPADASLTVTMGPTYTLTTLENQAAAANQPTDTAMQRFLERWKD